jgi:hypothetical protein
MENIIKMELREIGSVGVNWIVMAQDRGWCRTVMNTIMRILIP